MAYSERAYFDGDHCAHVAAWQEHNWLANRRAKAFGTDRRMDLRARAEHDHAILLMAA